MIKYWITPAGGIGHLDVDRAKREGFPCSCDGIDYQPLLIKAGLLRPEPKTTESHKRTV